MINYRCIYSSILIILIGYMASAQSPAVKTASGLVSGYQSGEIRIFKGIPFAAPPVGALRWKAPQPAVGWKGVRRCDTFAASPIQPKPAPFLCWSEEFIAPPEPLSEDCLYLNIWTGAKNKPEKRPVFVWIYGGGFNSGSAACAVYDGEDMAKKGVVFVSINYRVGPFGFMAHPELGKEQNGASGNYGLLDQIAALQWVRTNISSFGGDPARVTIGGQSAGSMSVNCLIASPLAKGLFQQAVAESGGVLGNRLAASLTDAEAIGAEFQKKTGAADISDLRRLSAAEILKASQSLGALRMGVALDGYVLPKDLITHFKEGRQNQVALLAGWVTGDAALFGPPDLNAKKFIDQASEKYGLLAPGFLSVFPAGNDAEAQASENRRALLNFAALPAYLLACYNSRPSFLYEDAYVPADKPGFPNYGAFHTSEVPFALHTLHLWKRPWQAADYAVEKQMSDYWIRFIKTGNPNGKGLPEWKAYDKSEGAILHIDAATVSKPGLYKNEFIILDKLANQN